CAGAAGRYFAYHDRLYAAQAAFERAKLIRYAADLGIDTAAFTRCLDRREFARAVDADVAEAHGLGLRATPSFLINGRPVVGALPIERFREVVEAALAEPRPAPGAHRANFARVTTRASTCVERPRDGRRGDLAGRRLSRAGVLLRPLHRAVDRVGAEKAERGPRLLLVLLARGRPHALPLR